MSLQKKYQVNLLLFFLFICPFLNAFGNIDNVSHFFEIFSPSKILNYGAIFLSGITLFWRKHIAKKLLVASGMIIIILSVNYFFAPFASEKWLLNWVGFTFVGLIIAQTVKSLTCEEMKLLYERSMSLIKLIILVFAGLATVAWVTNFFDLVRYILSGWFDHITFILSKAIGVEKQGLGIFFALLIIFFLSHHADITRGLRFLFMINTIIILPAALGNRTMWLSLFLCAAWVGVSKYRSQRMLAYATVIMALPLIIYFWHDFIYSAAEFYDRFSSLEFAWSLITSNIFGLGNGGYHIYVEANNDLIVELFGSEVMKEKGLFWAAPESDLVYFIASWGVLSIVFFIFFGYILRGGVRIFYGSVKLYPIERAMLLMAWIMIFMGISQDNAGTLIWWVYIAAAFGVILRHPASRKIRYQAGQNLKNQSIDRVFG